MRVLVTGATGQLGYEVAQGFGRSGHEVIAPARRELDFSHPEQVAESARTLQADWVINCAAYTQVDKAEADAPQAFIVNRDSPEQLAQAVADYGGRMLQVSTDFIFDGAQRRPYLETDSPNPLGVYGRSKLEGEQAVRRVLSDAVVLRTAWVYGVYGHNFVKTMLRMAAAGKPLRVVSDQVGTPTWTTDIAATIAALVARGATGTFNFTNAGETSWHGFASAILDEGLKTGFDIKTEVVSPIPTIDYPTPATRPAYSVLNTEKIRPLLPGPIPGWRESLKKMLQELYTCADCL
ncbi:MAG: dTDP-4-dehydrorhamnose reductase [Gammaproteobacteria bacterium]|nr:dTDP-4-dehydrorhamnose reductase [Gammaproteobacteria bacterium]